VENSFHTTTQKACADSALGEKLRNATDRPRAGRETICREFDGVERFRDLAAGLRDDVLAGLDGYLSEFVERTEAAGVRVHWASDAHAAQRAILGVAREQGVERIVKSKSMLTEEIDLSPVLEADGIDVVETDLGEFIIQLAGQKPSHIVMPAVHLSAAEVHEIFRHKIGYRGAADAEALTKAARDHLRGKFAAAQMGISGVNFAIADQGAWTICTNEGNGRYVAGLPRIYVAVMGLERIVRDGPDAAVILKLLARFATGQRITQYVNVARGPCAHDGPEQVHLVIVDNGRSRILGGDKWSMLRCIRCGACLNVCPVFRYIGGQSFPGCYSGPMGKVLLPLQKGLEIAGGPPKACSLCGVCGDVCPVKIPLPELLLELRNDLAEGGHGSVMERMGMKLGAWVFQHPLVYRLAQRVARFGLRPFGKEGWVEKLPSIPGEWTRVKDLPLPAKRSYLARRARQRDDKKETPNG